MRKKWEKIGESTVNGALSMNFMEHVGLQSGLFLPQSFRRVHPMFACNQFWYTNDRTCLPISRCKSTLRTACKSVKVSNHSCRRKLSDMPPTWQMVSTQCKRYCNTLQKLHSSDPPGQVQEKNGELGHVGTPTISIDFSYIIHRLSIY